MRRLEYQTINDLEPYSIEYAKWNYSIVLFGDSTTYGQGLEEEDRLHNIIDTVYPVINTAYIAESNEHIFKKFIDAVYKHGLPRAVIVGYSSPFREALVENNTIKSVGHWNKPDMDKETMLSRTGDIIKSIRLMTKNSPCILKEWTVFIQSDYYREQGVYNLPFEDYAKDGKHPGPKTIRTLSNWIGNV